MRIFVAFFSFPFSYFNHFDLFVITVIFVLLVGQHIHCEGVTRLWVILTTSLYIFRNVTNNTIS